MGVQYKETVAEAARRIRQTQAAPCAELTGGPEHGRQELCRLALIDAIEEASEFDLAPCQAGRIAEAVLALLRQRAPAPVFA
jgi:hypothetical protein